ncbi:MAG TPA: hypothetical protein VGY91_09990 [Chthoniobacterales bacterium]|jgi:hypothetical protein|nr:hypothetical protein [Chthoniobacterales bacterium]
MKGLLDALKVRTTGRRDRIYLHYFGTILDDGPTFIDLLCNQALIAHPKESGVRIQVLPKDRPENGSWPIDPADWSKATD